MKKLINTFEFILILFALKMCSSLSPFQTVIKGILKYNSSVRPDLMKIFERVADKPDVSR